MQYTYLSTLPGKSVLGAIFKFCLEIILECYITTYMEESIVICVKRVLKFVKSVLLPVEGSELQVDIDYLIIKMIYCK